MLQRFDLHPQTAMLDLAGVRERESRLAPTHEAPLMVLAGLSACRLSMAIAPHAQRCWVAAGPGNNGGDGLETALQLHLRGVPVTVTLLSPPDKLPLDAHAAWQRAHASGVEIVTDLPTWLDAMGPQDLCIDALLGIGASRAPQGALLQAIQALNSSPAQVLALDLPTGLAPHSGQTLESPDQLHAVVHADHTLTFLAAKPGLFMSHGRDVCGQIWLDTLVPPQDPSAFTMAPVAERNLPPHGAPPPHAGHKGTHGDVAVIGGEALSLRGMGMGGAALLAATAALNAGAGRVMLTWLGGQTEHLPELPDLMLRHFDCLELETLCVVCGCGGGTAIEAALPAIVQRSHRLVLDADALNVLARSRQLQDSLRRRAAGSTVLTPHPKEAARLLGSSVTQVQSDRLHSAQSLAAQFNCAVALKGSGTVIVAPGRTPRINTTGNGLLSIGGTGDVLAGLIGARMAQRHDAFEAASAAVWQHGRTADDWPHPATLTASRLAQALTR
jgi:hydroxyethylthiazole kinase-like uncharacterized protein yjeF